MKYWKCYQTHWQGYRLLFEGNGKTPAQMQKGGCFVCYTNPLLGYIIPKGCFQQI